MAPSTEAPAAPSHRGPRTRRRALALAATLAGGTLVGAGGYALTGAEAWFLAIPAGLAAVWLAIADPTQCAPCEPPAPRDPLQPPAPPPDPSSHSAGPAGRPPAQ